MIEHLHLLRPAWLLLLIPLGWLLISLYFSRRLAGNWAARCDVRLLPYILTGRSRAGARWPLAVVAFCGTLAIVALAGPAWLALPQPVFRNDAALVIALDLSRSMNAADVTPSRLERARHKIVDILERRGEGQTALIVYAAQAFAVTPLTQDVATIKALVPSLESALMPAQGSRIRAVLEKAADLLEQAGVPGGEVLLLTDGVEDEGYEAALERVRESGHRLHVLGIGTMDGAPIPGGQGGFLKDAEGKIVISRLDEPGLRRLAQLGAGRYHALTVGDRDLESLLHDNRLQQKAAGDQFDARTERWREEGPWLLLLVLPFAALAFRRGWLVCFLAVLMPMPQPVMALEWSDLWLRRDQQAAQALQAGDAEQAAALFEDPAWKAAAQYRAGDFQGSVESLDGLEATTTLYNKGNALARAGRYQEAIQAYNKALENDTEHQDARFNRDLLLKEMEGDQNQQQNEQGDQTTEQDQQQQSGNQGEESDDASNQSPGAQGEQQQSDSSQAGNQGDDTQGGSQDPDIAGQQPSNGSEQELGAQPEVAEASEDGADQDSNQEESQRGETAADASDEQLEQFESLQASEQWLRRVPDDPGGLLRRKFRYQYQRMPEYAEQDEQPW